MQTNKDETATDQSERMNISVIVIHGEANRLLDLYVANVRLHHGIGDDNSFPHQIVFKADQAGSVPHLRYLDMIPSEEAGASDTGQAAVAEPSLIGGAIGSYRETYMISAELETSLLARSLSRAYPDIHVFTLEYIGDDADPGYYRGGHKQPSPDRLLDR